MAQTIILTICDIFDHFLLKFSFWLSNHSEDFSSFHISQPSTWRWLNVKGSWHDTCIWKWSLWSWQSFQLFTAFLLWDFQIIQSGNLSYKFLHFFSLDSSWVKLDTQVLDCLSSTQCFGTFLTESSFCKSKVLWLSRLLTLLWFSKGYLTLCP